MYIYMYGRKHYAYLSSAPAAESTKSKELKHWKMGDETEYIKLKVVLSIKDRNKGIHLKVEQWSAGGWSGLQRDPLQGEADHPDGKAQEELQWAGQCGIKSGFFGKFMVMIRSDLFGRWTMIEIIPLGGSACYQLALPLWRQADQRWWNSQGSWDGTGGERPFILGHIVLESTHS